MNWNTVSSIAQTVEAISVVVALLYAWQQIKAIRQEISLGAVWNIFSELSSEQAQRSRKYVYQNREIFAALNEPDGTKLEDLSEEARQHAEKVSNSLDRIGYVVFEKLIPETVVLNGYHNIVARSWIVLEPYIKRVRENRDEATYQHHFEYLAQRTFQRYTTVKDASRSLNGKA